MPQAADGQAIQIDRFFAGPGSRGDQWRSLVEIAEAGDRAKFDAALRFAQFSRAAPSGAVTTIVLAPVDYESL